MSQLYKLAREVIKAANILRRQEIIKLAQLDPRMFAPMENFQPASTSGAISGALGNWRQGNTGIGPQNYIPNAFAGASPVKMLTNIFAPMAAKSMFGINMRPYNHEGVGTLQAGKGLVDEQQAIANRRIMGSTMGDPVTAWLESQHKGLAESPDKAGIIDKLKPYYTAMANFIPGGYPAALNSNGVQNMGRNFKLPNEKEVLIPTEGK